MNSLATPPVPSGSAAAEKAPPRLAVAIWRRRRNDEMLGRFNERDGSGRRLWPIKRLSLHYGLSLPHTKGELKEARLRLEGGIKTPEPLTAAEISALQRDYGVDLAPSSRGAKEGRAKKVHLSLGLGDRLASKRFIDKQREN